MIVQDYDTSTGCDGWTNLPTNNDGGKFGILIGLEGNRDEVEG